MRRVSSVHPFEDDLPCPSCKSVKGWRIEQRGYNKVGLCRCNGVVGDNGTFPHRPTHPMCDQHPRGAVNQARRAGATDDDIPLEFLGMPMKVEAECPF
jgi:hypothetical protein